MSDGDIGWLSVVSFTPRLLFPRGETPPPVPITEEADSTGNFLNAVHYRKIPCPARIRTPAVQPVAGAPNSALYFLAAGASSVLTVQ